MIFWWKSQRNGPMSRLQNDAKFRCCGCLHIVTGTVLFGIYNLIVQFICVGVLTAAVLYPSSRLLTNESSEFNFNKIVSSSGTAASGNGQPILPQTGLMDKRMEEKNNPYMKYIKPFDTTDAQMALLFVCGLSLMTWSLLYGTIKRRPGHLLPFFCFQVFDLMVSCLTAVGQYTWVPQAIHRTVAENPSIPFRDRLLAMDSQWLSAIVLASCFLLLVFKAYMVGVVWSTYQFIHLYNNTLHHDYAHLCPHVAMQRTVEEGQCTHPDAQLLLPPDYETASKLPPAYHPGPPPNYQ